MEAEERNSSEPVWPAGTPEKVKVQWRKEFDAAVESMSADTADTSAQFQAARREANRILRISKPTSYSGAMALENWQVVKRAVEDNAGVPTLKVVTIDGGKYSFPVPAPVAEESKPEQSAETNGGKPAPSAKPDGGKPAK